MGLFGAWLKPCPSENIAFHKYVRQNVACMCVRPNAPNHSRITRGIAPECLAFGPESPNEQGTIPEFSSTNQHLGLSHAVGYEQSHFTLEA